MPNTFIKLSEIDPSNPDTWNCVLTFDIDWACDEVLEDTIDLVESSGISATWFVTHDTPVLKRLRSNPAFEIGIHPNFNFLLNGDARNGGTAQEVVKRLLAIVPEAKTVRSHSLTQSSNILQIFADNGLTHEANHFIPEQAAIELKPWRLWNGLIKIPYLWEDDVACLYKENTPIQELTKRNGVRVFDFHPIHVFLNTESLDRYEGTREIHRDPKELSKHRYTGTGTRSHLKEILRLN